METRRDFLAKVYTNLNVTHHRQRLRREAVLQRLRRLRFPGRPGLPHELRRVAGQAPPAVGRRNTGYMNLYSSNLIGGLQGVSEIFLTRFNNGMKFILQGAKCGIFRLLKKGRAHMADEFCGIWVLRGI